MANGDDDEYFNAYGANEHIWQSHENNASDKVNAWRQQMLLLQHLTRNFDDSLHFTIMQDHYAKLAENACNTEYLQERTSNALSLLHECGRQPYKTKITNITDCTNADDLSIPPATCFEPVCRGVYESCRHNELTSEMLNQMQMTHIPNENPSQHLAIPQPHINPVKSRNTLANFLCPRPQKPEVPIVTFNDNSKYFKDKPHGNLSQKRPHSVNDNNANNDAFAAFRTAREELALQNTKKNNSAVNNAKPLQYGAVKKSLGTRVGVRSNFVPPVRGDSYNNANNNALTAGSCKNKQTTNDTSSPTCSPPFANIDAQMVEIIKSEIMHKYKPVAWEDIAGLEYAKTTIIEAVVYPLLRPDIFTGLRRPPRGILLFGPPGTGKTLIGKCIASQSKSTFFSINPSTLTSKWVGDGEKLVKALFAVAAEHQPAVIFMDEIDSLLSQRSTTEHESSRRLKNEFLIQLDGASTSDDERILIIGATNRPQELDEAARRRFVRRLYIPLPEMQARVQILYKLLKTVKNNLCDIDINEIAHLTDGYSGADIDCLCREASMEPIRAIPAAQMSVFNVENLRPITKSDFVSAIKNSRPTVSQEDLKQYIEWNSIYGAAR